jgi:hypothetical protein
MDQPARQPSTRLPRLVDAGLTLAAFGLFTWVLRSHVPSNDPTDIWLWSAVGASCLAALFWLALQMFRAVWRAQHARRDP